MNKTTYVLIVDRHNTLSIRRREKKRINWRVEAVRVLIVIAVSAAIFVPAAFM